MFDRPWSKRFGDAREKERGGGEGRGREERSACGGMDEFLWRCTGRRNATLPGSRVEGGEPRREHYAVHLAFSLINCGGAPANACVVAPVFTLVFFFFLVFFSFVCFWRFFLHFPSFHPSVCTGIAWFPSGRGEKSATFARDRKDEGESTLKSKIRGVAIKFRKLFLEKIYFEKYAD